jgi:hypothetical protein
VSRCARPVSFIVRPQEGVAVGKREEDDRDRDRDRALRIAARAGAEGGSVEEARAVGFLCGLSPAELVRVLDQVFAVAVPFPSETHITRSRFFLGVAWSDRTSPPGEPPEWGKWHVEAVARGVAIPGDSRASLHNERTCPVCQVRLRSWDCLMVCPVCGWDATRR